MGGSAKFGERKRWRRGGRERGGGPATQRRMDACRGRPAKDGGRGGEARHMIRCLSFPFSFSLHISSPTRYPTPSHPLLSSLPSLSFPLPPTLISFSSALLFQCPLSRPFPPSHPVSPLLLAARSSFAGIRNYLSRCGRGRGRLLNDIVRYQVSREGGEKEKTSDATCPSRRRERQLGDGEEGTT